MRRDSGSGTMRQVLYGPRGSDRPSDKADDFGKRNPDWISYHGVRTIIQRCGLGVEDDETGTVVESDHGQVCDGIHRERRTDGYENAGFECSAFRALKILRNEALPKRDGGRFQDSPAVPARR